MNRMEFLRRVEKRRKEMSLSERKVCLNAGLSDSYLRNVRRGTVQRPTVDAVQNLAEALGVSFNWLAGNDEDDKSARAPRGYATVYIIGAVQAGAWNEAVQWPRNRWRPITVPPEPRFPGVERYAFEVVGDSMNELYPDGSVVFTVRYIDIGRGPHHEEKVVVQRFRHGTVEATCKEFILMEDGSAWLMPRSTNKAYKPIMVPRSSLQPSRRKDALPPVVQAGDFNVIPKDLEEIAVSFLVTGFYAPQ